MGIYRVIQGAQPSALWQPRGMEGGRRWEVNLRGRGHMYTCDWFMLMYGRNQHNTIKQISCNKKKSTERVFSLTNKVQIRQVLKNEIQEKDNFLLIMQNAEVQIRWWLFSDVISDRLVTEDYEIKEDLRFDIAPIKVWETELTK